MAIWARGSSIASVKERPGTRQEGRASTWQTIRNAVRNNKRAEALHSFGISLLPFFNPDKDAIKALESLSFNIVTPDKYVEGIGPYKIFWALAFYCDRLDFKFRDELGVGIKDMATQFEQSSGIITSADDAAIDAIQTSIRKWQPNIGKGTITIERAKKMAEDVVNMMYVEYARENDDNLQASTTL